MTEKGREPPFIYKFTPQMPTMAKVGPVQLGNQNHSGLPRRWQGADDLGPLLLLSQMCEKEARTKLEVPGLEPALHMGCYCYNQQLNMLHHNARP